MPPPAVLDVVNLDPARLVYSQEEIYARLPQDHEFRQLHGILHLDLEGGTIAAFRDVRADEWWCRGHLPGRPIFPGILMMETAAQVSAFFRAMLAPDDTQFMGFGGVDGAKFRMAVTPPAQIIMTGKLIEQRSRRFVFDTQAYVGGTLAFEGRITGMPVRV